jgi:hypothetical protein
MALTSEPLPRNANGKVMKQQLRGVGGGAVVFGSASPYIGVGPGSGLAGGPAPLTL